MSQEKLYDDIVDELYQRATPGIEEIERTEYSGETGVNLLHYLPENEMEEVIEHYCDEYDVTGQRKRTVQRSVVLGPAPSTSLNLVDERRREEGLKPVTEILENGSEEVSME